MSPLLSFLIHTTASPNNYTSSMNSFVLPQNTSLLNHYSSSISFFHHINIFPRYLLLTSTSTSYLDIYFLPRHLLLTSTSTSYVDIYFLPRHLLLQQTLSSPSNRSCKQPYPSPAISHPCHLHRMLSALKLN
jgi:hypothetical protein